MVNFRTFGFVEPGVVILNHLWVSWFKSELTRDSKQPKFSWFKLVFLFGYEISEICMSKVRAEALCLWFTLDWCSNWTVLCVTSSVIKVSNLTSSKKAIPVPVLTGRQAGGKVGMWQSCVALSHDPLHLSGPVYVSSLLRCIGANGLLASKNGPTGYLGDFVRCLFFRRWRCLCGVSSLLLQRLFSPNFVFCILARQLWFAVFGLRAKGVFFSQGGSKVM